MLEMKKALCQDPGTSGKKAEVFRSTRMSCGSRSGVSNGQELILECLHFCIWPKGVKPESKLFTFEGHFLQFLSSCYLELQAKATGTSTRL